MNRFQDAGAVCVLEHDSTPSKPAFHPSAQQARLRRPLEVAKEDHVHIAKRVGVLPATAFAMTARMVGN